MPKRLTRRGAVESSARLRFTMMGALLALAGLSSACRGGDYYYVGAVGGEGDTLRVVFLYTCGRVDLNWDGTFVGERPFYAEITVHHDDLGRTCGNEEREVDFDVGPMKRAFRSEHPSQDAALALRVIPYQSDQHVECIDDVFDISWRGNFCH